MGAVIVAVAFFRLAEGASQEAQEQPWLPVVVPRVVPVCLLPLLLLAPGGRFEHEELHAWTGGGGRVDQQRKLPSVAVIVVALTIIIIVVVVRVLVQSRCDGHNEEGISSAPTSIVIRFIAGVLVIFVLLFLVIAPAGLV